MLRTKQTGEPKLSILKNSITEELIMLEGIKSPVSKKSPIAELKNRIPRDFESLRRGMSTLSIRRETAFTKIGARRTNEITTAIKILRLKLPGCIKIR